MINTPTRIHVTRFQVISLKVRHLVKDLHSGQSCCEQIQNIADTNAHSTNAGTPTALFWIYRDSIQQIFHVSN